MCWEMFVCVHIQPSAMSCVLCVARTSIIIVLLRGYMFVSPYFIDELYFFHCIPLSCCVSPWPLRSGGMHGTPVYTHAWHTCTLLCAHLCNLNPVSFSLSPSALSITQQPRDRWVSSSSSSSSNSKAEEERQQRILWRHGVYAQPRTLNSYGALSRRSGICT